VYHALRLQCRLYRCLNVRRTTMTSFCSVQNLPDRLLDHLMECLKCHSFRLILGYLLSRHCLISRWPLCNLRQSGHLSFVCLGPVLICLLLWNSAGLMSHILSVLVPYFVGILTPQRTLPSRLARCRHLHCQHSPAQHSSDAGRESTPS